MQPKRFSEYAPIPEADGTELVPIVKAGANSAILVKDLPVSDPAQAAIDELQAQIDLINYAYPSFSSFAIDGQSQNVEVGAIVDGSPTFSWAVSNDANVVPNSVAITGPNSLNSTGHPPDGSAALAIGTNQLNAAGSLTWTATGQTTQDQFISRNFVINWLWRIFVGTSVNVTLTEAQIEALASNGLAANGFGTFDLAAGGYKYFCFPTSMAAASDFVDEDSGFGVDMAGVAEDASFSNTANGINYAIVSLTNANGVSQDYRVYRTKFVLGGAITVEVS